MYKPYAFSQNEYLNVHPLHLNNAVTELEACCDMLWIIAQQTQALQEPGLASIVEIVIERLQDTEQKLMPEAVQERFDKMQSEACHAN